MNAPPFCKQQATKRPTNGVWVYTGTRAWERARGDLDTPSRLSTCLPWHDDPGAYRWPVAGEEVMVVHTGGEHPETLRELAETLIHHGAALVVVLDEGQKPHYFRPMVVGVAA